MTDKEQTGYRQGIGLLLAARVYMVRIWSLYPPYMLAL
jgi:hypothetical protein